MRDFKTMFLNKEHVCNTLKFSSSSDLSIILKNEEHKFGFAQSLRTRDKIVPNKDAVY